MIKRFVQIHAIYDPETLDVEEGLPVPIGYCQTIGCTARGEEDLQSQVRFHVAEELGIFVDVEDQCEPDFARLNDAVRETISAHPEEWGLWYKSGHATYLKGDASS